MVEGGVRDDQGFWSELERWNSYIWDGKVCTRAGLMGIAKFKHVIFEMPIRPPSRDME